MTASLALTGFLGFMRRSWPVVEQMRKIDGHKWATTISAIIAAAIIIGNMLFGAGGVLATNTAGMTQFGAQLASLTEQVSRLSAKIDAGPRPDQIVSLGQTVAAQGGRMDSMDTRLRDIEAARAALDARMGLIERSNSAPLGHK